MEGVKGGVVRVGSWSDFGKASWLCFWHLTCGDYTKIVGWTGLVSVVAPRGVAVGFG